jgi:ATP phosphoribosyltransferase regulatory subunit
MTTRDRWLLPEGIEETLPPEARRLESLRRAVLDLFERWGYALIMPPLVEFLDSLLTGVGRDMDLQTFKVTDQLSGRLMGIRADITPQAARIDAHYLRAGHAQRLCYLGTVLHTRPAALAGTREPLKLGAELFGHAGPESDAEVLALMLTTLALTGIDNAHVDLGHVGVFDGLIAHAGLNGARKEELLETVERRARSEVEALLAGWNVAEQDRRRIVALLELSGGAEVLARARALYAPVAPALAAIDNLEAIEAHVRCMVPKARLHFDLAELGGYRYYTGATFSAYVPGEGRAIANGGRYDGIGRAFGRDRAATGFGADLRRLLKVAGPPPVNVGGILAPAGRDPALYAEIARLRTAGERVVQQLPGDRGTAADFECDRLLRNVNGRWQVVPSETAG